MKLSLSAAELLTQLQTVTRVASTRSAVQALSGVMISAQDGSPPELLATDMEIGLRVPLAGRGASPGSAVLPARLLLDVARSLPAEQLTLELRSAEQDVELICGAGHLPPAHAARRGLPDAAGALAGDADRAAGRGLRADGLPRGALGLARRDPPRAHRHPDVGLRPGAADGRDRLLPAERQGDRARGAAAGQPRGERPGPRAAGARADRPAGRATSRSPSASGRTRSSSSSATSCSPRA